MTQQAHGWVPDPSTDFGARLALVRQHMAWNGKQAADACNIDPQSWRSWETAGRRPRDYAKVCQRVSEASGVSVIWLMTGQSPDGEWLPRRDSNLEPSDYRPLAEVVELGSRSVAARTDDRESPDYRTPSTVTALAGRRAS